jgi:Divergent InlB B-repeat domain
MNRAPVVPGMVPPTPRVRAIRLRPRSRPAPLPIALVVIGLLASGLPIAAPPAAAVSPAGEPPPSPGPELRNAATRLPTASPLPPPGPSGAIALPADARGVQLPPSVRFPGLLGHSGAPPGAAYALQALGAAGPNGSWQNRFCNGLWPNTWSGASLYVGDCYGHDEPGLQFYSDLPGSGGNVTWNVTLPTDAGPTANQSDLYVAIWFGLTLTAPFAWMHECFLELQFYPDASYYAGTSVVPTWNQNDNWVGAAVAWQINVTTGYEDACYYSPLYDRGVPGPAVFNMTGGDRIEIRMAGYPTSPAGETIALNDLTESAYSYVDLYDRGAGVPLDPAYSTNSFENALQWTPGGEYPVVFAFETGHPGNPSFPDNGSTGGCDPGPPPASSADWAVPCPSYDPGSWVNDTRTPWSVEPPTFTGNGSSERPAQVAFSQDLGGIDLVDVQNGSYWRCGDRVGSAYCSYPWYSYSCGRQAFEFGATDWADTTVDFGQYLEYTRGATANAAGLGYYAPTNVSIPACDRPSSGVLVGTDAARPGGSVYFLSRPYVTPVNLTGLTNGSYALHALPVAGRGFAGWRTSGGVAVATPTSPWTSLRVSGPGSVLATFTATPHLTTVRFNASPAAASGGVGVVNGSILVGTGTSSRTVPWGSTIAVAPGIYGIEAYPPPGHEFARYAPSGPGVEVAATGFPFTWMIVDGSAASVTLTAELRSTGAPAQINFGPWGPGSVTFGGSGLGNLSTTVGAYRAVAVPAPGATFTGWVYYGSDEMTNFSADTTVVLEPGRSWLYAEFARTVNVQLTVLPSASGRIAFGGGAPLANGTEFGAAYHTYYALDAVPGAGAAFVGWSVNASAAGYILYAGSAIGAYLYANASVTVSLQLAAAPTVALTVRTSAPTAGLVEVNYGAAVGNGTVLSNLTAGAYRIGALPASGYTFVGWSYSGGAYASGTYLYLSAAGTLTANFARPQYAVTFLATPPTSSVLLQVNGAGVPLGDTVVLTAGTNSAQLLLRFGEYLHAWVASPGIALAPNGSSLSLTVGGPGTVIAELANFSAGPLRPSATALEVGDLLNVTVALAGGGPFGLSWSGLPPGCASGGASVACRPTASGNYSVRVRVVANDIVEWVGPVNLSVVDALRFVSLTASVALLEVGSSVTLRTATAGGQTPWHYAYAGLPPGCATEDTAQLLCSPSAAGAYAIQVLVGDRLGHLAGGATNLTVASALSIGSVAIDPATGAVGAAMAITVVAAGGVGPFTYAYLGGPPGCPSANVTPLNCRPTSAGVFPMVLVLNDSAGRSVTTSITLVVRTALAIGSFAARPGTVTVGESTVLAANATGGVEPLAYRYAGLPPYCASSNVSSLTCVPSAAGLYTVELVVSDASGARAFANTSLTVQIAPANPGGGGNAPTPWGAIAVGVGVAFLVLLGALLLRRGSPKLPARARPAPRPTPPAAPDGGPDPEREPAGAT